MLVEPVANAPAAVVDLATERALVIADFHAGIEAGLRYERGVELDSAAARRRDRVCSLLDRCDVDRLIVVGDLAHRISTPDGEERDEIEALIAAVTDRVPMTLVEGNHDGGVEATFGDAIQIVPAGGGRIGDVGFVHGHTWPDPEVLAAEVVCIGHEHPQVRLQDSVGGHRTERVWLRGPLRKAPFRRQIGAAVDDRWGCPELVVFPAFNDRSGGTWVNVEGGSFLTPFLPEGLIEGELYLLDGTRLGPYQDV